MCVYIFIYYNRIRAYNTGETAGNIRTDCILQQLNTNYGTLMTMLRRLPGYSANKWPVHNTTSKVTVESGQSELYPPLYKEPVWLLEQRSMGALTDNSSKCMLSIAGVNFCDFFNAILAFKSRCCWWNCEDNA